MQKSHRCSRRIGISFRSPSRLVDLHLLELLDILIHLLQRPGAPLRARAALTALERLLSCANPQEAAKRCSKAIKGRRKRNLLLSMRHILGVTSKPRTPLDPL